MSRGNEKYLLGKRIVRIVRNERIEHPSLETQLFLVFEDGSYMELYSDGSLVASKVEAGDPMEYASKWDGTIKIFDDADSA